MLIPFLYIHDGVSVVAWMFIVGHLVAIVRTSNQSRIAYPVKMLLVAHCSAQTLLIGHGRTLSSTGFAWSTCEALTLPLTLPRTTTGYMSGEPGSTIKRSFDLRAEPRAGFRRP